MSIYIGLDLGCTGCKAIAIDEDGKTQAAASVRYDGTLIRILPYWAGQAWSA